MPRYQELVPVPFFAAMRELREWEREAGFRAWLRQFLLGEHESMRRLRDAVARIVHLKDPVLVSGEVGTGKELVSIALHVGSPRGSKPWLVVPPRGGDAFRG